MGHITSATSVYSVAYLTEKGRALLFDENNTRFITDPGNGTTVDLFKIEYFTLSDPDMNYHLSPGYRLVSGEVPDVSGKNEDCIKGAMDMEETCLLSYDGTIPGNDVNDDNFDYDYGTELPNDVLVINANISTMPDMLPTDN